MTPSWEGCLWYRMLSPLDWAKVDTFQEYSLMGHFQSHFEHNQVNLDVIAWLNRQDLLRHQPDDPWVHTPDAKWPAILLSCCLRGYESFQDTLPQHFPMQPWYVPLTSQGILGYFHESIPSWERIEFLNRLCDSKADWASYMDPPTQAWWARHRTSFEALLVQHQTFDTLAYDETRTAFHVALDEQWKLFLLTLHASSSSVEPSESFKPKRL